MAIGFIIFDLRADLTADSVIDLMGRCAGQGWRFLKKAIVCDDMPGDRQVPNDPALFPRAWQNALRAAPRSGGMVWMEMENYDELKLTWGYDPKQPQRFLLTIDLAVLRRRDQTANARALAAAADTVYAALLPTHGYGFFNYDLHLPQPVGAGLTAIWDYNYLSAELVDGVGRARLGQLPAFRSAPLPDGGLVLEMAANPIAEAAANTQFYRHAAQMLGITYHQGGA